MSEVVGSEPFVEYSALLDVQMDLHTRLQAASPDEAADIRDDITRVNQDIAALQADSTLAESALRYGAVLAREAEALGQPDTEVQMEIGEAYAHRLRQMAAFVLERAPDSPELAEDPRFYDIQAALGCLAADKVVAFEGKDPLSVTSQAEAQPLEPVDYEIALKHVRIYLGTMAPGESCKLRPQEILTLAAPHMAFSRWQRYRLLRQARQVLTEEGYLFRHNKGRGRSSAYIVGRHAPPERETSD